jgi:DnaJ-class molecular chaperone
MEKKIFDPERYGMVICPSCNSEGYIQNPKRECCLECGGFGFVKRLKEKETNIPNVFTNEYQE